MPDWAIALAKLGCRGGLLVVTILCLTFAPPALGADREKAAAKAHYEAATRLYDIHEYDAALKEYKAGYLTRPDPSFLYNIGQCYKRLGKPVQAREFFQEYLKKAPIDDPNRAQGEARLRELDAGMDGKISPPPASPELNLPAGRDTSTGYVPPVQIPTTKSSVPPSAIRPDDPGPNLAAGLDFSTSNSATAATRSPPYYETWWFWTGVGALVAAGVVTAIVWPRNNDQLSVSGTTLGTRTVLQ
jgi:tetratricopeptide (TPR) repeat protein